jgi:hypothetical protein
VIDPAADACRSLRPYGEDVTPMLAVTVALIPFAALIGPLVWMARMSA